MLDLLSHRVGPPAAIAVDRDLRRRLVPAFHALVRLGYFGLEIEGAEHLPRDGHAIYAQNHAGWFPLDAFVLGVAVGKVLGEDAMPVFAAHDSAMAAPVLGPFLGRAGAVPASWLRRPERLPPELRALGIFPEGVAGNTKPFWRAYRMRPWSRGFVRAAAALELPIVPTAVIGGEECLPVAWTVRLLEPLIGSSLGLPLSLVPLPSRWKIVFHPPVQVEGGRAALTDTPYCTEVAGRLRGVVQRTLDASARERPLGKLSSLVARVERRIPIIGGRPEVAVRGSRDPAPRDGAGPRPVRRRPRRAPVARIPRPEAQYTASSSTSNTSVAFGGMSGGAPRAP